MFRGNVFICPIRCVHLLMMVVAAFVMMFPKVSPGIDLPLRWRWSNPGPHGNTVYDMTSRFGLAVQVGELGHIYSSSDLILWEPHESGTTQSLRSVDFQGGRLLVTGANGTALYADSLADIRSATVTPPTSDWLEDVVATPSLLVSVGDNGAIYTSGQGTEWSRQSVPFSEWLSSVTRGPNGRFVAVGEKGSILTSMNGTNWTQRTSGTSQWLNHVAYHNNLFWVFGQNGTVLGSAEGIDWTVVVTGATGSLFTSAFGSGALLAAGDSELRIGAGAPLVWSNQYDAGAPYPPVNWTWFAADRFAPYFIIAGRSGMLARGFGLGTVPETWVWEDPFGSVRNWLWDLHRHPDFFTAVGDFATILTSDDGVDWQLELIPSSATNSIFLGIGGDTNSLVTVGTDGAVLYSPNFLTNIVSTNNVGGEPVVVTNSFNTIGTIWHAVEPRPVAMDLQGITVFNGQMIACGEGGVILTSTDQGTNWIQRISPVSAYLSGAAANDRLAVVVGDAGTILASADGVDWSAVASGATDWLYRVRWLGDRFVAVGDNGALLVSESGMDWTAQSSGTANWINDVTRLNDPDETFFAAGNQGTVLISTNTTDWFPVSAITGKSLFAVSHNHEGRLIAAGLDGAILRAETLPLTNAIEILNYERGIQQSSYLFSGETGLQFTLDRSSLLTNWTTGPLLEFLDGSDTLLYIEQHPTNPPSMEFYRGVNAP